MDDDASTGPSGSDVNGGAKPVATNPHELANKETSDPNQTAADEPESGAGYGNHAMPDIAPADK